MGWPSGSIGCHNGSEAVLAGPPGIILDPGCAEVGAGGCCDMRLRIKALIVAASTMATLAGCQEPKEIVPVAPPGFEITRTPTTPQGEGAQAIGEQGAVAAGGRSKAAKAISASSPPTPIGKGTTTPSGLSYETLKEGTGATAMSGQTVTMHYTGTLDDGQVFDSSRTTNKPFVTAIGLGQVIPGWDEGVPGMKVGERRKLIIPGSLGYGAAGSPPKIPPNATLTFDVELLDVK
jgi:FKBP-type peptidyl-prolyl cis-trans isomerase FkpA